MSLLILARQRSGLKQVSSLRLNLGAMLAQTPLRRAAKTLILLLLLGAQPGMTGHALVPIRLKMMLWTAPTLRHRCAKGWLR